jgi:oxygen-independent coproporphyrinogen III oxidase
MNAYLHIPFCASLCHYCDFTSFAGRDGKIGVYVRALCKEIENSNLAGPLQTIYFGGGTPSLLSPGDLQKLLNALQTKAGFDPTVEISMEANPDTVSHDKLKGYRALGVNRLSFGAQAYQKTLLMKLGRRHEWGDVEKAVCEARETGFENINLDLMFGIPEQTFGMFQETLKKAIAIKPEHLSLYALQVEPGTPLSRLVEDGLRVPEEDLTADEYGFAQETLACEGYEQYEVSNFAEPGCRCRHNWNIWRGRDYWGFGVSAVGTVEGVRYQHGDDLEHYLENPCRLEDGQPEKLTEATRAFESIMLGLRTREGIPQKDLERYVESTGAAMDRKFPVFLREGLLELAQGRYRVTRKGYFVLNGLLEELLV